MNLDTPSLYETHDPSNLRSALARLHEQFGAAWVDTQGLSIPTSHKGVDRIILVGMGGSALGAHVVKSVFADELTVPFEIVNGYKLPGSATKSSLVILSSFSGTTEEVLAAYKEAKAKKVKMFVMCAGGPLAALAKKDKVPSYVFEPGGLAPQPRYGVGFSVMGIIGILRQVGAFKVNNGTLSMLVKKLEEGGMQWGPDVPTEKNAAKQLAHTLVLGRVPVLVASEHLEGAMHVVTNMFHETAKRFTTSFPLPELNHHHMEGLTFPKEVVEKLSYLFFESKLYHPRVQLRYPLTEEVVEKNGAEVVRIELGGSTKLEQAAEVIQLGGYVTFYMAMLSGVNPEFTPWVKWFKERLK